MAVWKQKLVLFGGIIIITTPLVVLCEAVLASDLINLCSVTLCYRSTLIFCSMSGFYDALSETKYYNDMWTFDLGSEKWKKVDFPPLTGLPPPRSGFHLSIMADTAFIYGMIMANDLVS